MPTLTVRDETISGDEFATLTLDLLTERLDARELIRSRVYQEVREYNAAPPGRWRGLVQPMDAERALNGERITARRPLDWEQQFARALEGFVRGRFLILVDDRQIETLDEPLVLQPGSAVTFLRLVPLVGG